MKSSTSEIHFVVKIYILVYDTDSNCVEMQDMNILVTFNYQEYPSCKIHHTRNMVFYNFREAMYC